MADGANPSMARNSAFIRNRHNASQLQ